MCVSLLITSKISPSVPMTNVVRLTGRMNERRPGETPRAGHGAVFIGEQRVVEVVLVGELFLLVDRVDADAYALGANLSNSVLRSEVASFRGASAGHRARVEEQHDRPFAEHLAEPTRLPGFVR